MTNYVSKFNVRSESGEATIAHVRDWELGVFDVKLKQLEGRPYLSQMIAGETVLFIGDSYTYGTGASDHNAGAGPDTKRWSSIVARTLGCNEINVAVGSTGFVDPGSSGQNMPFITQFNNWYSNASTSLRNEVRAVFVAGGYNDVWNSDSSWNTVLSASRTICNRIHSALPNAILVLVPMMYCGYDYTVKARNLYHAIIRGAQSCSHPERVCCIKWAFTWTAYDADIASDGIHPNDNGHLHIAQGVLQGLNDPEGASSDTWETMTYSSGSGVSEGSQNFVERVKDKVTRFSTRFVFSTPLVANERRTIGTIPRTITPIMNVYAPFYYGDEVTGTLCVLPDGRIIIHNTSGSSMPQGYVTDLTWCWFGNAREV